MVSVIPNSSLCDSRVIPSKSDLTKSDLTKLNLLKYYAENRFNCYLDWYEISLELLSELDFKSNSESYFDPDSEPDKLDDVYKIAMRDDTFVKPSNKTLR